MSATDCAACQSLARVGVPLQCNRCRAEAPNARTLTQREIVAYMNETGCTPTEAEAHFGVTAGRTFGG